MSGPANGTPWHNLDAERRVVGALLREPDRVAALGDRLMPADLYHEPHRHVLTALRALSAVGTEITLETVGHEMGGRMDACGGPMFLAHLLADCVTTVGHDAHVAIVADHARRRRVIRALTDAATAGYSRDVELDDWIATVERDVLAAVRERDAGRGPRDVAEIGVRVLEALRTRQGSDGGVIAPTGLHALDRQLSGGLREGELCILGARPGMGKTSLALQIAAHVGRRCQGAGRGRVLVCSLEMLGEALVERMLADGPVDLGGLRRGEYTDAQLTEITRRWTSRVAPGRLWIDDRSATLERIASETRRIGDPVLLVVDYLQLVRGVRGGSREQEVSALARGLKELARDLHCAVLCLAQLSRAVEARTDKRPQLADLKESGDIEAAADVVLMLYRDEYYHPASADTGIAEVIVAKQRNGGTGTVRVAFDGPRVRFGDLSRRVDGPGREWREGEW